MRPHTRAYGGAFVAGLVVSLSAGSAAAGGLYFAERGVRPLARGGAFVAGANDLGAIYYNPAGIYDAKSQFLFDAAFLNFDTEYTRRQLLRQVDPNTGEVVGTFEQTFDTVEGASQPIPIPTLAASYQVADEWVVALGAYAPYASITDFPENLTTGEPSPSRYSLITLEGSALVIAGAYVAYAPNDQWRFGLGLQALAGNFVATQIFGACVPDRFLCAPEQPEWDALAQLSVGPIFAPSGNLGVTYIPHEQWRIGAAFQAPFAVRAPAKLSVRLPSTPTFERSSVDGDEGDVNFELPWAARLGVQFSPLPELQIEVAGAVEGWAMHDSIVMTPDGIGIRDIPGFPNPYRIPVQTIPRNFQNTYSVRLGGEYTYQLDDEMGLAFRGGASWESSAIPPEYLSVLTIDTDKVTLGAGLGLAYGAWRFDAVYAHVFGFDVDLPPDEARIPLLQPLAANQPDPYYINGGSYSARANVVGIGLTVNYESALVPDEEPEAEPPPEKDEDEDA